MALLTILHRWKTHLPKFDESALQVLAATLAPSLRPLIGPAREAQAGILGISLDQVKGGGQAKSSLHEFDLNFDDPTSEIISAELFTDGINLFVLLVERQERTSARTPEAYLSEARPRSRGRVTLSLVYIGPTVICPLLDTVKISINKAFGVTLNLAPFESRWFKELRDEGRTPPPPLEASAVLASRALRDRHARTLALAIKSSGGLLVSDLTKQLPAEAKGQVGSLRETLETQKLIEAEIVVVCSKSQAQISRVASRDVLQGMASLGVKCACGRPIQDERIEEALSITGKGRSLLDGNRWLTLLLLEELLRVGVSLDQILIEQQLGGDEVDCLANISGELVFLS